MFTKQYFMQNIKKLTCPVLLLHGEEDVFVFNAPFETVQKEAPNCRKLLYKGTYHEVRALSTLLLL
jgi:alpha-beta hydrolase superfamily lysophospholipase